MKKFRAERDNSYFDYDRPYDYRDYDAYEGSDLVPRALPSERRFKDTPDEELDRLVNFSPRYKEPERRPVSHPEFPGNSSFPMYEGASTRDALSLSLDLDLSPGPSVSSPRKHFSPFPARNPARKPKELALKLGLYSPPDSTQLKRS